MELIFKKRYEKLSDKEIVDKVITPPHDEEAATYLLWNRYGSLLYKHFHQLIHLDPYEWYDYSVEGLFDYLRGGNGRWEKLSNFKWNARFCCWFKKVSYNYFNSLRDNLIEKGIVIISIDSDGSKIKKFEPVDDSHERNRIKVHVIEAIQKLEDIDQKFVVMKRLEGYKSKEIANLLQQMWDRNGIVRMDKGKVIKASAGYVDVRMQRAKENLKKIIVTID